MEIQTENKRSPTVDTIRRDAPETMVETDNFENLVGLKTEQQSGIQTKKQDAPHTEQPSPSHNKLQRKKYIVADMDSDDSAAIETAQAVTGAVDTVMQTGGSIRTAVKSSVEGIGKIHTMIKQGVQVGTVKDVGKVAALIGSGIQSQMASAVTDAGTRLLKTKIDKSTVTDTGTESIKQRLTEVRYADNARKAVQNTARGTINAAAAIRSMPKDTKAQVARIRKNAQRARQAARKTADGIRKVLSSKAGILIMLAMLMILLLIFLLNGAVTLITAMVTSLFSWMFPDGDTSEIQDNIRTYISQIQSMEAEKQAEIDEIVNSLSPEYRYDDSQITGLNQFGNSSLTPYDENAVLAVLAVQKYRSIQETDSPDFHFTEDEIRTALEQFYEFSYRYEYDYCPDCDCSKDPDCVLSLADGDFRISGTAYDDESDCYSVTMTGTTYSHASDMYTWLEIHMRGGGTITGDYGADVDSGTWSVTYNIPDDLYRSIDWGEFYLTVDTVYCNDPNHCYLYGYVANLNEAGVLMRAGLTADEQKMYWLYLEQISAMGG